jgi:hypothetical protein
VDKEAWEVWKNHPYPPDETTKSVYRGIARGINRWWND